MSKGMKQSLSFEGEEEEWIESVGDTAFGKRDDG